MKCPFCTYTESKVVDSRPAEDSEKIRRRRECLSCGKRFTTYEVIENTPLIVVKKDKLLRGLLRACEKRPISVKTLESLVDSIEQTYANEMINEVRSTDLGEQVLRELKKLDKVAYIRFASVYRDFSDVDSFLQELKRLQEEN